MTDSDAGDAVPEGGFLIKRPQEILNELSLTHRWEVTRRHPYYLMFWEMATTKGADPIEQHRRTAAELILRLIGVSDIPPPPSQTAEQIGFDKLPKAFKGGAVVPVRIRSLLGMLITTLPPETKRQFADFLRRSADIDVSNSDQIVPFFRELSQAQFPQIDDLLPELIVRINPHAPQNAITDAVEQIVRDLKSRLQIANSRRRDDKFDLYLAVWDLREGWTGEGYDRSREKSVQEISRQLREPTSTVMN